jgi:TetR/AcrR family transcriptional regulator
MPPGKIDEKTILDAAAEVFAEDGYAGARIDVIAARAGVNKAMLYYRIGDKKELYRRVVLRGQAGFRDAIVESMESASDAPGTMKAVLERISELAFTDNLLPSIILREMAGGARNLPEEGRDGIRRFMTMVRSIVSMGVEEGTFRKVDPVALQFSVIGAVFTLSLTCALRSELSPAQPGPVSPGDAAAALQDIFMHGILSERRAP